MSAIAKRAFKRAMVKERHTGRASAKSFRKWKRARFRAMKIATA